MALGFDALQRGKVLVAAGSTADAVEAFKSAGESGLAEGYIELAVIEIDRGNREGARGWMQKAEALAERGDALANLSCSLAHQLGYGEGSFEEEEQRARFFLRKAAELGNPVAQSMLAQQLLWGLNGEERNEREYETWISRAMEQGLPEAVITHVENRLQLKRDIEPAAMMKLEELATHSKQAKTLLQKATRAGGARGSKGSPTEPSSS